MGTEKKKFEIEHLINLSNILEVANPNHDKKTKLKISIENEKITFIMNEMAFSDISWDDIEMESEKDLGMAFYHWLMNFFDTESKEIEKHPYSNARQFSELYKMNGNEIKSLMFYLYEMMGSPFDIKFDIMMMDILDKKNPHYNEEVELKILLKNGKIVFCLGDNEFPEIQIEDFRINSSKELAKSFYYWSDSLFNRETKELDTDPDSMAQIFSKQFQMNSGEIIMLMDYLYQVFEGH